MSLPRLSRTPLIDYLDSDLAADLAQGRGLPAAVRADLAVELRRWLAAYAAYIPDRLVRAQLADPTPGRVGGAFWQGSLLFADLSGFTALSEKLSVLGKQGAEEISAVVNRLFNALVDEVIAHQGGLLKFGGDALTAFFDAETLGPVHAAAAAHAALEMQARMDDFAALETRAGTFRLQLRVGVHSGRVFAAEVGDLSHIELVITGAEVNRVALAQEIAAPGEVVISDQTAALLAGARLEPRRAGFQHILGLPEAELPPPPADLLTPDGPTDLATLERLAAQVEALRPYLVRALPQRFLEAISFRLGEFRPVSVLFANVHDFSALLAELGDDAATAAAAFNAYYRRAQTIVHRYDGIINKVDMYTHGDKLMALFGAPTAHEDDPLRAVRCALELEAALDEANREINQLLGQDWPHTALHQRIGINTGAVFAGRVGGARRYEYTVMGPAVNLAARLMTAAADGAILLSPATRAAVARQVAVKEQPPIQLKGLAGPVVPVRALHLFETERLAEANPEISLHRPPLVGRDAELERLAAEAAMALRGAGRVLALVGDAGAGKTRLSEELIQRLVLMSVAAPGPDAVPSFQIYTGDCQSYDQRTPYAVMRGPLRHLLGVNLRRESGPQARERRGTRSLVPSSLELQLQMRVEQLAPDLARFVPLLSDVLGLDLAETQLIRTLTPAQRHDRVQELVTALWCGAANREPLLLALDGLHWADSASLELLERMAGAAAGAPLLLLLTYRSDPPIAEKWTDLPTTTRLALDDLPPERGAELIAALLGGMPPPAVLSLLDRTQGNPFFIEELVRALVVAGALSRDETRAWQLTRPLEQIAIPDSIEGLLIARLDRLDEPRYELVEVASVVGRRFQHPVVQGIYRNPAPLDEGLARLIAMELILSEQQERELAYLFRHALVRDVAYEGILYARRRMLHQHVARRIEELYGGAGVSGNEHLSLLAWHYLRAEDWLPAFRYHLAAGVQAQRRYANRDALALFATALEIAPRLAVSADAGWLVEQVAELHERSGDIHVLLGEYEQAEAAYREALALLDARDTGGAGRVRLHRLLAQVHERRSAYDAAFDWLERGMSRANSADQAELTRCYLMGAGIYQRLGEYARSQEWARLGLSLAERLGDIADQAHALSLIGNLWQHQGEFVAGITTLERARALFEQVNDATGLSNVLNNLGVAYLQVGRWQDTIRCYEQSLQISQNVGDVQAMARTSNNLAVVLVGRNELQRAGELYRYSGEQFGRIGSVLGVAVTGYNRGEVLLLQGQAAAALPLFQESIATFERIKARNFLPEALRLAAEASLELDDSAQARAYAGESLAVADELGLTVESAVARRVLGQIALQSGNLAAAADLLEQSRAALEQLDNRYELGRALIWQARLAQAQDRHDKALAALRQAEPIFVALDAQRDLAGVQALLATLAAD